MELQILFHAVDVVENVIDDSWDDTLEIGIANNAFHCMGLTGRSLTIGKNGAIITVKDI